MFHITQNICDPNDARRTTSRSKCRSNAHAARRDLLRVAGHLLGACAWLWRTPCAADYREGGGPVLPSSCAADAMAQRGVPIDPRHKASSIVARHAPPHAADCRKVVELGQIRAKCLSMLARLWTRATNVGQIVVKFGTSLAQLGRVCPALAIFVGFVQIWAKSGLTRAHVGQFGSKCST